MSQTVKTSVLVVGAGPAGVTIANHLGMYGVDTLVLELNSDTVRALKREGQLVLFADATHPEALDLAGDLVRRPQEFR